MRLAGGAAICSSSVAICDEVLLLPADERLLGLKGAAAAAGKSRSSRKAGSMRGYFAS